MFNLVPLQSLYSDRPLLLDFYLLMPKAVHRMIYYECLKPHNFLLARFFASNGLIPKVYRLWCNNMYLIFCLAVLRLCYIKSSMCVRLLTQFAAALLYDYMREVGHVNQDQRCSSSYTLCWLLTAEMKQTQALSGIPRSSQKGSGHDLPIQSSSLWLKHCIWRFDFIVSWLTTVMHWFSFMPHYFWYW